jgi:hypothetical protein
MALLLVGLAVGWIAYSSSQSARLLAEAMAEADRLDPGWRLEELEAKRKIVPDSANGALQVSKAHRALAARWTSTAHNNALQGDLSTKPLTAEQMSVLESDCRVAATALYEARKLADLPDGRFPISYNRRPATTPVPHLQEVREIGRLLEGFILLSSENGNSDEALGSCQALLNCGRAIGNEPLITSQMVRLAERRAVLRLAERVLARGLPSESALSALQRLLEQDARDPVLLYVLRGERAVTDREVELTQTQHQWQSRLRAVVGNPSNAAGPLRMLARDGLAPERAEILRFNNSLIEIIKGPTQGWQNALQNLAAAHPEAPELLRMWRSAAAGLAKSFMEADAELRGMVVLIACERWLRRHGHWPQSLQQLVTDYLAQVPEDPFDGKPLRYRRLADGVVVYSIGGNGRDDGGAIRKEGKTPGDDVGHQLWDVGKRQVRGSGEHSTPR